MTLASIGCGYSSSHTTHLDQLALSDVTVLIGGETGSGKGVYARSMHARSRRREQNFVVADCSALTVSLFESQMFGHVRGAFTGASSDRLGLVRAADGGTLFLDEVGELPLELQAKLLTLIEERTILPVGSERRVTVDFRLIAATHRNLSAMVESGRFREDLFYRLAVVEITVPSLRERCDELPRLIDELIEKKARLLGVPSRPASAECYMALLGYPWPGNIRELGHAIERALVMSQGNFLELSALPVRIVEHFAAHRDTFGHRAELIHRTREHLDSALEAADGNKSQAARMLGISRRHLYRLLRSAH